MAERFDEQMAQMKSEINQSQLSDHRAEKDIHQIVSDVFRLDELSWGIIRICIAQLLFGCMNVYVWRKRQTNPVGVVGALAPFTFEAFSEIL